MLTLPSLCITGKLYTDRRSVNSVCMQTALVGRTHGCRPLEADPAPPPPVDRQTPVKAIPRPKLRLRAVQDHLSQKTLYVL